MMNFLKLASIECPNCGEAIDVLIDGSVEEQEYIEDCQVCCCPIALTVSVADNEIVYLDARSGND